MGDTEPPNNPYGIGNRTYARYRHLIERQKADAIAYQKRAFNYERFSRRGLFPENLTSMFQVRSKDEAALLEVIKRDHFDQFTLAGRFRFIRMYILEFWRRNKVADDFVQKFPGQLRMTQVFSSSLGNVLKALYLDAESLYFSFTPPKNDNDQTNIRLDMDFNFPFVSVIRHRNPEILMTPHDAGGGLSRILGKAPIFCWQVLNEEEALMEFYACWVNGLCLRLQYGLHGLSLCTIGYLHAIPTLNNAFNACVAKIDHFPMNDLSSFLKGAESPLVSL